MTTTAAAPPLNPPSDADLATLRALSDQFHNVDAALAEIARLSAVQTLPKGTVHVISDVHGEDKKLRHVINNASGTLRPLVEKRFAGRMSPDELREFLTLIFYPAEVTDQMIARKPPAEEVRAFAIKSLLRQFELVRVLASSFSFRRSMAVFPAEYKDLFLEMFHAPTPERGEQFVEAAVNELAKAGKALHLVHLTGRLIRNLAIYELVIGGDCWDRGPRGDRVVDYVRQQPHVSFVWGNHDVAWLGACLGHDALVCHVLRVSLRYRRLGQLDEGYSIPLTPLEHLARVAYGDDPATQFMPKASGMRPNELVAKMQKAAAVMQFKLEGQMIARHPEWGMDHRRLLHRIDHAKGTVEIDGKAYALRDKLFPTIDPADPYALSADEQDCLDRVRRSFRNSQKLYEHMRYLTGIGSMHLRRDEHLIFHGCVPADAAGNFLPMPVDGRELAGRPLFEAIDRVILRAIDECRPDDLDTLWYLWSGPRSPLFGKDRITTFERDFVLDKHTHEETKDPYFALINEAWFCERVLTEFGVCPRDGLIVNGHVPVKIEKGESPIKRSGKAITIDGAFSEAYGDHGYTLVLESDRTQLALHHHFESVESAVQTGVDIVPQVTTVRTWDRPRRMSDTERGQEMGRQIELLGRLVEAYKDNRLRQRGDGRGA